MKINKVKIYSTNYTGLIKTGKIIPSNIMINPTKEQLKKAELEWQRQIEQMGLKVIKQVTLFVKENRGS